MKLHFIISHIIGFSVCELIVAAMLAATLWSYKKEKGYPTRQRESEELIGAIIVIQLSGAMFMILDIVSPSLVHFAFNSGVVGIMVFAPVILFSGFLSARIITPARILKMVGFTK